MATYSIVMGVLCVVVVIFNLHNEAYALLFLIGGNLSRSLGNVLILDEMFAMPPVSIAGGALVWLSTVRAIKSLRFPPNSTKSLLWRLWFDLLRLRLLEC